MAAIQVTCSMLPHPRASLAERPLLGLISQLLQMIWLTLWITCLHQFIHLWIRETGPYNKSTVPRSYSIRQWSKSKETEGWEGPVNVVTVSITRSIMHDFISYRLIRNFKENSSEERRSGVGKAVVWLFQNECVWLKTGHQWQTKETIPLKSSLVNQWVYWDYWQEPVRM